MFIEPPIISFNTTLLNITHKLEELLFDKKIKKNTPLLLTTKSNIIFVNDSVYLFDFVKISIINNEFAFNFLRPLNKDELKIVNNLYQNYGELTAILIQYILLFKQMIEDYTNHIPFEFIETVSKLIVDSKNIGTNYNYYLPIRDKLINNLNYKDKRFGETLINNDWFLLKIIPQDSIFFDYYIYRVSDPEINPNKYSDERYFELDLIKSSKEHKRQISDFLINLFCYGKLIQ